MVAHYRRQVANLAEVLKWDENRGAAAYILRSLVDRIELTPNEQGRLEIDLYLAGILRLARQKDRPLDQSDPSVQQVKLVAGGSQPPLPNTCRMEAPFQALIRGSKFRARPLARFLHKGPGHNWTVPPCSESESHLLFPPSADRQFSRQTQGSGF